MRTIDFCYDVETLKGPGEVEGGWDNPQAMGLRSAVVYDYQRDLYLFVESKKELREMFSGHLVLGFNSVKFDNNVIERNDKEDAWFDVDLLRDACQAKWGVPDVKTAEDQNPGKVHDGSIGLKGLGLGTLGREKIGHGSESPKYAVSRLWEYNLQDVRLTVQLQRFRERYGYLVDGKGNKLVL